LPHPPRSDGGFAGAGDAGGAGHDDKELEPIEGFPIVPADARHYWLAHGLRTLLEDVVPHLQAGPYDGDRPVDASAFVATLTRVELELKSAYAKAREQS
jgi:hypothetical protein